MLPCGQMLDNRQVRVLILVHVPDVFFDDFRDFRRSSRQMVWLFLKVGQGRFVFHVFHLIYPQLRVFYMSYWQIR